MPHRTTAEPTRLLINIDHVATLRNARQERFPDPVHAAILAEKAGADGIVFHPREDRRHITDRDVRLLKETVTTKLDFELSTNDEIVALCCEIKPHLATLVPEKRQEITTEGGIDVLGHLERLRGVTGRLYDAGIEEVAYFVDPVPEQIEASARAGANCIELHTGDYANAATAAARLAEATRLATAAEQAHALGLRVHAGHGLDYHNFTLFKNTVPHLHEVSIGFAVVARAVLVGFEEAVREMLRVVKS
ncbi:MAG: pyridoxine 5'-phosphate synthase [Rhodothermales bacterium]